MKVFGIFPRAHHLVTAEEGGQLTHRNNRVILNHEDAHTPIVVAITLTYPSTYPSASDDDKQGAFVLTE